MIMIIIILIITKIYTPSRNCTHPARGHTVATGTELQLFHRSPSSRGEYLEQAVRVG